MLNYKLNDIIQCKVTGIQKYGVFVYIDENYSGLIHISEISSSYVRNINDYVTIGEIIQAKILDIAPKGDQIQLKLSIKDMDYRVSKKTNKIEETKTGFCNLRKNLNEWIENKYSQIIEKIE